MLRLLKFIKNEKGQTLVEFGLVLPVLLILVMGIIQFGFIFSAKIALTNAVREGARVAAVGVKLDNNGIIPGVKSTVINSIDNHGYIIVDESNIEMDYPEVGFPVTVKIIEPKVKLFAPVPEIFAPGQIITLKNFEASMRLEIKP